MAGEEQREAPTLDERESDADADADEESDEEREIRELEQEVSEMGQRILDHRRNLPDQLVRDISARLVALRPILPSPPHLITAEMQEESVAEDDQEILEKLQIFKAKSASNIAAMPVILRRLNECIARIEKVEGYNVTIDPVFKRIRKH